MSVHSRAENIGVDSLSKAARWRKVFLRATFVLPLASACSGESDYTNLAASGTGTLAADGMTFPSEPSALSWVSQRAANLELGPVAEERDEEGRLIRVFGMSVGSPEEIASRRTRLFDEIGGADRRVIIGATAYSLGVDADAPLGTTTQALCSGSLCTEDESYRQNLVLYHELGSRTSVTAGGFEVQRQTIFGQGIYECVDLPGPLPEQCRGYCNYSRDCPSGFSIESHNGYPACQRICRGNVRNVTITVETSGFQANVQTLPPQRETTHDSSLEVSYWEWGVSGGVVSQANGVCGAHSTRGPDGLVSATTQDGDVPNSICNAIVF